MTTRTLRPRLRNGRQGYQPDGYEWPQNRYTLGHDPKVLGHDLFHHQLNETGEIWEEVRAIGGLIIFMDKFPSQRIIDILYKGCRDLPVRRDFAHIELPEKFMEASQHLEMPSIENFLNIVREGFHHAQQFSIDAWQTFITYDFQTAFDQRLTLEVDLLTGLVKIDD